MRPLTAACCLFLAANPGCGALTAATVAVHVYDPRAVTYGRRDVSPVTLPPCPPGDPLTYTTCREANGAISAAQLESVFTDAPVMLVDARNRIVVRAAVDGVPYSRRASDLSVVPDVRGGYRATLSTPWSNVRRIDHLVSSWDLALAGGFATILGAVGTAFTLGDTPGLRPVGVVLLGLEVAPIVYGIVAVVLSAGTVCSDRPGQRPCASLEHRTRVPPE